MLLFVHLLIHLTGLLLFTRHWVVSLQSLCYYPLCNGACPCSHLLISSEGCDKEAGKPEGNGIGRKTKVRGEEYFTYETQTDSATKF